MPKIKLKEWAEKHDLSYLTANRHFHAGMIPGAIQLDSGTILVEDDSLEQNMANSTSGDAMSLFLKKTVEFSKNNSSVEDFAAYVISNFQLKLNTGSDSPKYSKNKPKPEEVQKHFQQFIPDKEKSEQLKTMKSLLKEGKAEGVVSENISVEDFNNLMQGQDMLENLFDGVTPSTPTTDVRMYGETPTEGLVTRSVDLNTTPQQINYTGSTNQAFSSSLSSVSSLSGNLSENFVTPSVAAIGDTVPMSNMYFNGATSQTLFQPTQKELLSAAKVIETAETEDMPCKRGRKPSKKR